MTTTKLARYFWSRGGADGSEHLLIDRVTAHPIASITYLESSRRWQWSRSTMALLHGVAPASGRAKLLADAKRNIESGLPEEFF